MSTTGSNGPPVDWHDGSSGQGLVWHPAIRALGWVFRWAWVAGCAAVGWEFLTLGTARAFTRPALTAALAAWILVAVGMLLALELVFELCWALTRHMHAQYPRDFARKASLVISAVFVVFAIPLVWGCRWALGWIWQTLHEWAGRVPWTVVPRTGPPELEWPWIVLMSAVSGGLAWMVVCGLPATAKRYRVAARCLGLRRMVKGMLYMTSFRMRQPRRVFFAQAPVVSDVPLWALCVMSHVGLRGSVFAWVLPLPMLAVSILYALSKVVPAVWLYLGASELDSFRIFHTLRHAWFWHNAVTLLDRESKAGITAYYSETEFLARRSQVVAALRNPGAARLWSLRTRPSLSAQTVKSLMDLVAVIVVDARVGSEPVRYELEWLAQPGRIGKAWLLVKDQGTGELPFPPERWSPRRLCVTLPGDRTAC